MFQRQPKALLAVTAGAIAVSAFGFMAWRTLGPSEPTTLPPAERAAKLQHVERVFPRKFPTVSSMPDCSCSRRSNRVAQGCATLCTKPGNRQRWTVHWQQQSVQVNQMP